MAFSRRCDSPNEKIPSNGLKVPRGPSARRPGDRSSFPIQHAAGQGVATQIDELRGPVSGTVRTALVRRDEGACMRSFFLLEVRARCSRLAIVRRRWILPSGRGSRGPRPIRSSGTTFRIHPGREPPGARGSTVDATSAGSQPAGRSPGSQPGARRPTCWLARLDRLARPITRADARPAWRRGGLGRSARNRDQWSPRRVQLSAPPRGRGRCRRPRPDPQGTEHRGLQDARGDERALERRRPGHRRSRVPPAAEPPSWKSRAAPDQHSTSSASAGPCVERATLEVQVAAPRA